MQTVTIKKSPNPGEAILVVSLSMLTRAGLAVGDKVDVVSDVFELDGIVHKSVTLTRHDKRQEPGPTVCPHCGSDKAILPHSTYQQKGGNVSVYVRCGKCRRVFRAPPTLISAKQVEKEN